MFPSFTYRNVPGMSGPGGTMTTFDGVGVRTGPPLFALPLPGKRRQVPAEEPEADDPDDDQAGERERRGGIDRQAPAAGRRCGPARPGWSARHQVAGA